MAKTKLPLITRFGLPGISRVPYGMHACHFYSNREQLVSALMPYFVAGLRGNERCLWVTAPPLPACEAIEALRTARNEIDETVQTGALRILDFDQWYANSAGLKGTDVVQLWLEEEKRALAEGYNGLRIAGNLSFLTSNDWSTFMEYEQAVTARFKNRHIIAFCSYFLPQCDQQQMREAMHAHHCALDGSDVTWHVV